MQSKVRREKRYSLLWKQRGYNTSTEIPVNEKEKIDFAKKYFEALKEYYKDKNINISFKERINKTQLAALIMEN